MRKILYIFGIFSVLFLWLSYGFALDSIYTGWTNNKAVRGYDTVAYFTEGKPVKGVKDYSIEYKGADWYFSSAENLALFRSDPEKYAPQFGGYCAYAVAHGTDASTEPEFWAIVDGKLYLNYSKSVQGKWDANRVDFIGQAHSKWKGVLCKGGGSDPVCE